uniref:DDE-1 domain-containing protein n=1 Tax=Trichuris muris TaxID=70415 RepID=A0A5S6QGW0_TRIMR
MDQGVIENLKRLYRKQLLRHLLLTEDRSVQSVLDFYKTITLKDCCYMIADSWSSIKQFTLRNSWNNIFVHRKSNATPGLGDTDMEMKVLLDGLKAVSLSSECEEADVEMWLSCDHDDPGLQIFEDDEIIEAVSNVDNEMDEDTDEGEEAQTASRSHDTAFRCLETALEWFECQQECDPAMLLCLKNIRDLAAKKRTTTLRQTSITDFFKQNQYPMES